MITIEQLSRFKGSYCPENEAISTILLQHADTLLEPILDVGCGIGDIALKAFSNRQAILIDLLPPSAAYGASPLHSRYTCDYYDFRSSGKIGTILFAHVLQFLDDRPALLIRKTVELDAERIVTVMNKNDGFMLEILNWFSLSGISINPEREVVDFPPGYEIVDEVPFSTMLECNDFEQLAEQVEYLMIADPIRRETLVQFLETHLNNPTFNINQCVTFYEK